MSWASDGLVCCTLASLWTCGRQFLVSVAFTCSLPKSFENKSGSIPVSFPHLHLIGQLRVRLPSRTVSYIRRKAALTSPCSSTLREGHWYLIQRESLLCIHSLFPSTLTTCDDVHSFPLLPWTYV